MTEAPGATAADSPEPVPDDDAAAPSLRDRLVPPMPGDRLWGWVFPLLVTALAAVLRLWDLGKPKAVMFDETYYAKDAWSLLKFGYERNWVDGANEKILAGQTDWTGPNAVLKDSAEYVVHPPVGKWVIALGEMFFGLTPFGWRIGGAVLSIVAVLVLCRVARRMFRSTLIGCIAGLVLAVDGLALVMGRTALLDGILMAFVLFAFGCLVLDRDWGRARIAERTMALVGDAELPIGSRIETDGPRLWWRPWRVAAGVFLGLAIGVKWNGLFFLVAFGLMVLFWDAGARKAIGVRHYRAAAAKLDVWPLALALVVLPVVVYVASWSGWIVNWGDDAGYYRNWAAGRGTAELFGVNIPLVPDWLRSLWHYHAEAYRFHRNLESPHPYESNPWGWLLLARPVAVYYESVKTCSSGNCSSAITALGNPLVWWVGVLALFHSLWRWTAHRDWRGGAIIAGLVGGLLPWFMYQERTIFSFYAVVLVPFVALALAQLAAALMSATSRTTRRSGVIDAATSYRRNLGAVVVAAYVAGIVLLTAYFWPVLTGDVIPYADWLRRMWFKSWI